MLRDTLLRLAPVCPASRTLILTNATLADAIRRDLPELPADHVVAEPRAAGTAAALTWAAHEVARRAGRDAVMLSVHADSAIGDVAVFQQTMLRAAAAAEQHGALVTVGIVPQHADTGLGYIEPGEPLDAHVRRVARFVEKPSADRATELVAAGALWNSGIFAWRVGDLLDEVQALCPEVAPALAAHPDDLAAFFAAVRSVAIDVGVLERSRKVAVIPGDFGWSDVGTWSALRTVRALDAQGNAPHGATYLRDARGNVVHSEQGTVVLYGVDDLVVVTANGITLVTTMEGASDLKRLLDSLPPDVRDR
jgi:mannose-1-phosphate guanylyltransferase